MRRLGQYELLRQIGRGGMAGVWMGRRAAMDGVTKAVAIKLPTEELAASAHYRDMFLREARLAMLLSHSNVVQVFDVGQEGHQPFMIMEWVDGMNLSELARQLRAADHRMPLPVVAFVVGEVLRGLAYAHTITHEGDPLGVVHRDVSPQNVLISVSGEVKLTDFGVARLAQEETSGVHVKGKLRYMAPEQVQGDSSRPTVDLYAVGAILHELLDGSKFRDARDETHLYGLALSGQVPPLRHPDVPRELDALRLALLEPAPRHRVQSAEEALELLMRWPGYRNASLELGRLCRAFMGVTGPRSGIHGRTTRSTAGSPESTDASPSDPLATRTWAGSGSENSAPAVAPAAGTASPRSSVGLVAVLAFAAALLLGAGGTAVAGLVWGLGPLANDAVGEAPQATSDGVGAAEPTSELAEAGLSSDRLAEPSLPAGAQAELVADAAAAQSGPSLEPDRALGIDTEAVGAAASSSARQGRDGARPRSTARAQPRSTESISSPPEAEPDGGSDSGPAPVTPPGPEAEDSASAGPEGGRGQPETTPKAAARVSVTFKTGDFPFVYVKVAGKVLPLEPIKKVKLPVGKHTVYLRVAESEPWKAAGTLDLVAGFHYGARMRKPAGVEISSEPE